MRMTLVGIVTAVVAGGALAAPDSTQNAPPRDEGGLPSQYQVLLSRSVFAAGGKPDASAEDAAPVSPEAALALKGVVEDGRRFTAFIEDLPHKQVLELKVGDPVARGHIVAISLHDLQYEFGGKLTRVAIGQPLSGTDGPTTQPSEGPAAPAVASTPQHRHHSAVAEAR